MESRRSQKDDRTLLGSALRVAAWVLGVLVFAVIALFLVIGLLLNGLGNSCASKRSVVYQQAQAAAPAFNRLVIIMGLAGKPAVESKQAGDCTDSLPIAWLRRTFAVHETAGAAMTEVAASLHSQGYSGPINTGPSSNVSPCGTDQDEAYSKPNMPIIAVTANCNDSLAAGGNWQSLPVTRVYAQLTFTAQP